MIIKYKKKKPIQNSSYSTDYPLTNNAISIINKWEDFSIIDLDLRESLINEFANTFNIGIPENYINFEDYIVKDDFHYNIDEFYKYFKDKNQCFIDSFKKNYLSLPFEDHSYSFYKEIILDNGKKMLIENARVSIPYNHINKNDMVKKSLEMGFNVTEHSNWSWHNRGNTFLFIFTKKFDEKLFKKSLRFFIINYKKEIQIHPEFKKYHLKENYIKFCLDYIEKDPTFPLIIDSPKDIYKKYLNPVFNIKQKTDSEYFYFLTAIINIWKNNLLNK